MRVCIIQILCECKCVLFEHIYVYVYSSLGQGGSKVTKLLTYAYVCVCTRETKKNIAVKNVSAGWLNVYICEATSKSKKNV